MKKFLIYGALFVLPLIVALVSLECLLRQVPNPYKYKYEWMQKNAEDVEVLVLGNSHTFYGIRPEFLDGKAFNLANGSQGMKEDLFLLKYWADRYKKLKTVIYPISFSTWFVGRELEDDIEAYRCRYYTIYMDGNLYPSLPYYNFELGDYRTAKDKAARIISSKDDPGCDEYGWSTAYSLSKKKMNKWNDGTEADAAVKRHTAKGWNHIDLHYARMKELANFCKSRNIQLILITTPCWHSYYDHLDNKQLAKMHELTNRCVEESGAIYLDYLKDQRFEADDFFDSNHLSDIGATKFTKILNEDLNKSVLESGQQ